MNDRALCVLVPTVRPHRIAEALENALENTPPPVRILFVCDHEDDATQKAVLDANGELWLHDGSWGSKINAGLEVTSEPLIFTGADDLRFHPGWLEVCLEKLTEGIGVVGTNDLCNRRVMAGQHSTHSLVTRAYTELGTIDEPGILKLCHEGYEHEFVDDELVATAKHRGAYAHAGEAVVEHLHPQAGKAEVDPIYAEQAQRMRRDRPIFRAREPLWM